MRLMTKLVFVAACAVGVGILATKISEKGHSDEVNFLFDAANDYAKKHMDNKDAKLASDILIESIKNLSNNNHPPMNRNQFPPNNNSKGEVN